MHTVLLAQLPSHSDSCACSSPLTHGAPNTEAGYEGQMGPQPTFILLKPNQFYLCTECIHSLLGSRRAKLLVYRLLPAKQKLCVC